jgi:hypothetical protein
MTSYTQGYRLDTYRPVRCVNYHICETELSDWLRNGESHKCDNCKKIFGTETKKKQMCIVKECLGCHQKSKRGVSLPQYNDEVCHNCFRVGYLGSAPVLRKEPDFPDPDLEHEYFTDSSHPKFQTPMFQNYARDWEEWDREVQLAYSMKNRQR